MQKLSKTLAIVGLMAPLSAGALGTGEIKLYSALNQRLNAEVPLVIAPSEQIGDLRVNLASAEAFAKAGLERPYYLTGLRFEVLSKGRATPLVRITSNDTIREPYVNFLMELQWSQGHVLREFTLLLDPPSTFKERQAAERNLPRVAGAAPAAVLQPVAAGDLHATPDSFSGGEYGPVRSGETLWSIAKVVGRDREATVEQMVVALYEANPQAFPKPNLFSFQPGVKLRVPGASQAKGHSPAEAKQIIQEQHAIWRGKAVPAKPAAVAAVPAASAPAPAAEKPLTLLAPERPDNAAGKKPAAGPSKGELALEIADTVKQENEDIRGRLANLEQQLQLMQRVISLKDQQIAALQAGRPMPPLPADLLAQPLLPSVGALPQPATPVAPVPAATPAPAAIPAAPAAAVPAAAPGAATPVAPTPPPVAAPPAVASEPAKPADTAAAVPAPAKPAEPAAPPVAAEPAAAPALQPPATTPAPAPVKPAAPPKPKPAVKPAPAPEAAEGFFGDYSMGLLGALGLLVSGLAWLAVKRRRAALAEIDNAMPAAEFRPMDLTQAAEKRPAEAGTASGLITPSQHGSFLSDFTPSDFDVLDSDNEAIDPISEADVYLAYGRYSQAEELIRQAINENPFRDECKLKLLEVFYTAQDREAFEKYVAELLEENKNNDHDFWVRVVDMGRSLAPDNPIFGQGQAASSEAPPLAAEPVATATEEPQPVPPVAAPLEHEDDFAFDLGDDAFATIGEAGEAFLASFSQATPDTAPSAADTLPPDSVQAVVVVLEEEPVGLDFDLDLAVESLPEPEAMDFSLAAEPLAEAAQAPAAAASEKDPSLLEFDVSALSGGGFKFAGVEQSADEPEPLVEDEHGRTMEFSVPESSDLLGADEFEFDLSSPVFSQAEEEAMPQPEENAPVLPVPLPLENFDLTQVIPAMPEVIPAAAPVQEDEEFDFDMNFDFSGQDLAAAHDESDLEAPQDLTDMDEMETKLDLAKAYIDMGSPESAKPMLDDVLHSGDARQKAEAQALLDELAGKAS